MSESRDNESLWKKLNGKGLLDEFCELMFAQGVIYEELLEQLKKWGINSSMGALSRFSDTQRSPWTFRRAQRQYQSVLEDEGIDLTQAQRRVVAERLYNHAASPNISEKALLKMRDQEIKLAVLAQNDERLRQSERRLKILETQVKDATDALDDAALTDEEKVARWKQVFGR